jgi:transcriptional regulator with XRE-family HTH domain
MSIRRTNKSNESLNENQLNYQKIGNRIRQLRIKAGYSSAEKFAYEYDISRTQYARYELGADMRISSILKIAAAHNITLHEFFKGIV